MIPSTLPEMRIVQRTPKQVLRMLLLSAYERSAWLSEGQLKVMMPMQREKIIELLLEQAEGNYYLLCRARAGAADIKEFQLCEVTDK